MATRADRPRIPLRWHLAEEDDEGTLFPDETAVTRHVGTGEFRGMEFLHVNARSIINAVPAASRMSFRYTINPYRGCSHACGYCFARPTHDYLGLNIGEDFERRIVVKVNTVERLRAELRSPKWAGEHIAMGTNTDPYQLAEGKYHLTQGVIRTLTDARNPFSILTKSTLILRDLDLLVSAARRDVGAPQLLDRHARPGRLEADRTRNPATGAAADGRPALQRRGHPVRCARRAGTARAVGRRRAGPRGRRGLRRRRRHLGGGHPAPPTAGRPRALHGLAGNGPAGPRSRSTSDGSAAARTSRRPRRPGLPHWWPAS